MVDINLFDDEMEEANQEQGDQSFDNADDTSAGGLDLGEDLSGSDLESEGGFEEALGETDLNGESLDDALGFDEDLPDGDELDAESLMGDDLGDLDEGDVGLDDEDYDFGGGQHKKVSPLLWILMLIVVAVAAIYIFRPELLPIPGSSIKKPTMTRTPGQKTQSRGGQVKPRGSVVPGETKQPGALASDSTKAVAAQAGTAAPGPAAKCITASAKILNDLTSQGQFAMLMVDRDRFTVEYASSNKGASETFGQRLKTLTGAKSYISSPEDMHTIDGQPVYFGVISGKFESDESERAGGHPFASENVFINSMKTKIQQQGLSETGQKKQSSQSQGLQQQVNYEWILEGEKTKVTAFLQSLNTLPGKWEPVKIRVSPVELNDFQARKVKLVLDLMATIGKTQTSASKPAM